MPAAQLAVLSPAGPVAAAEKLILFDSLAMMLAIIVPVIGATLLVAWWFRASNPRARRRPGWIYCGRIEIVVWSIPALVILFLGGIAWTGSHALDPAKPLELPAPALDVEVVALDWKWLFIYPQQQVAAINRLIVPAGTPLHLKLTSASVLNVFFVPQLGSMLYCMNGMAGDLYLAAARPGRWFGLSAMFSGDGFPDMHFEVEALPPAEFQRWAAGLSGTAPKLDERLYRTLLKQSSAEPVRFYGDVQPGLFDAIVMQHLPPGEGPAATPEAQEGAPGGQGGLTQADRS